MKNPCPDAAAAPAIGRIEQLTVGPLRTMDAANYWELHYGKVAAERDSLKARLAEAEAGLREIAAFGLRNSGCGYSCARKAEAVLKRLTDSAGASRDE